MKKHKSATIIIIIVIVAAVIFFMMAKVANVASDMLKTREKARIQQQVDDLNSFDYTIYWIGTPPAQLQELLGDNLCVLSNDGVNYNSMPYSDSFIDVEDRDENGNIIEQHQRWEYSEKLLIVINADESLSEDALEVVRECVVNNNIPLLLIGGTAITDFRSMMFMSVGQYSSSSTMMYSSNYDVNYIKLDEESVVSGDQKYVESFLTFAIDVFSLPEPEPVVIYQPLPTEESFVDETVETYLENSDGIEG